MKTRRGFTVIELIFVIVLLGAASLIFFSQKHGITVANQNATRKTAINAMYYSLEEVYYPAHNSYPQTINSSILPSVDPALFKDPSGNAIGTGKSNYRYTATDCTNGACAHYTLRSTLVQEADYVKISRH